jgi:hypothetical protein
MRRATTTEDPTAAPGPLVLAAGRRLATGERSTASSAEQGSKRSLQASSYSPEAALARLSGALESRALDRPHGRRGVQSTQLDDPLEILILMAVERDPRFDRAAARWVGRLLAETPIGLADGRYVLALVERLP